MTYRVRNSCLSTLDRSCVEVCPVDCFYYLNDPKLNEKEGKGPNPAGEFGMLVIHDDECIHCGACEPECPSSAICEDTAVSAEDEELVKITTETIRSMSDDELDKARCTQKK